MNSFSKAAASSQHSSSTLILQTLNASSSRQPKFQYSESLKNVSGLTTCHLSIKY